MWTLEVSFLIRFVGSFAPDPLCSSAVIFFASMACNRKIAIWVASASEQFLVQ